MVWGASYLVAKSITPFASVPAMLAIRFTIAGLIMMAVWLFRREPFSRADVVLGTLFGVTQASIMLVETYGLKETSATNAGLLISLTLVFTPILESAWSKNWLPKTYFIAVTVSIVGVLLLVSGNGFKERNFGDFLMLLAALIRRSQGFVFQRDLAADAGVRSYLLRTRCARDHFSNSEFWGAAVERDTLPHFVLHHLRLCDSALGD